MVNLPDILLKNKIYFDIKELKKELNKIKIELNNIENGVKKSLELFEKRNIDYSKKYSDLEQEIRILSMDISEKNFNLNKDEIIISKEKTDNDKMCKELYNSISKRCHPDKTGGDDFLDEIFRTAVEAYARRDFIELDGLLKELETGKVTNMDILKNKNIENLEFEYNILLNEIIKNQQKLNNAKTSIQYRIYKLTESNDDIDIMIANKFFIDMILVKIMDAKNKRDKIKRS